MENPEEALQRNRKTMDLVSQIIGDAKNAGKSWSWCWHNEPAGDTVMITVTDPEKRTPHKGAMVPRFYIAKIYNGELISEMSV